MNNIPSVRTALRGLIAVFACLAAPVLAQPVVGLSGTTLAFGGQSMSTTSPGQALTISNTGTGTLTVASITSDNPQFTVGGTCTDIAAGAGCTVSVFFTPAIVAGALNSTAPVAGSLSIASNAAGSPNAVALTGTAERSLVSHYYRAILGRAPDAGGQAFWEGEAARVANTLGANVNETWFAMAIAFYFSAEYTARNRDSNGFVTDLYVTFFNRQPDGGGQAFWVGNLAGGMPREVVLASFLFSAEFSGFSQAIFGNTTVRREIDVVMDFYRGILARTPDDGGFHFWLELFRRAQCGSGSAVLAAAESISSQFVASGEYAARNRTNAQFVGDLYNAFLRRGGDLAGVQFWITQLATQSRNQVRQQFVNSPEFQARVSQLVGEGCNANAGQLRVSVGGFGRVSSSAGGISCGHVPAIVQATGTKCIAEDMSGNVTLTAQPFSVAFEFSGWAGDTNCTTSTTCIVDMSAPKWVRAKFTPVQRNGDVCDAMGLVSAKNNRPLRGDYPDLARLEAFTDPDFGTTIRRVTDVTHDGRSINTTLVPAYSTISAWNSDETYLILYRTGGNNGGHELFNGKTYQFIRLLDDLTTADLEQFYWDATKPNILYGVNSSLRILVRYDVDAPRASRTTTVHDFKDICSVTQPLAGGSDPFWSSWDSRVFGLSCGPSGPSISYNTVTDAVASNTADPRTPTDAPQALPSGTKMFLNTRDGIAPRLRIFNTNMVAGAFLDQRSPFEHGGTNRLFNGDDTHNAVQFEVGPSGTDVGTVVQWNFNAAPNAANRIRGRIIVGPDTGYPYPATGVHVSGVSFHRTGLIGVSSMGAPSAQTLLEGELMYIDSDLETNPGNFACRVGHHRTGDAGYFGEPHVTISPSGTRLLFGSSWGTGPVFPVIDSYVVELPGFKP